MIIRGDRLHWLFWLRWTLFARRFTQGTGRGWRLAAFIISLCVFTLCGIVLAAGCFLVARFLPAPFNTELLFLTLTLMYLIWLFLPLVGFNTNEGLDLSKLSLFPLSRFEIMASLLISTLLDTPTIIVFFVLGGIVVGWAFSLPLALFVLLAMLIFYVQLIGISQLILAVLLRFLQSRRFRDLAVIVTAVLSLSGYLCQFASRGLGAQSSGIVGSLENAAYSPYLQWTPPGMAARAVQQAVTGQWGSAFIWLAALLIISVLVLYLWQLIVARTLAAPETGGSMRGVRQGARRPAERRVLAQTQPVRVGWNFLPAQSLAMLRKDMKYYWREPQIKVRVARSFFVIFLLAFLYINPNTGGFWGNWKMFYLPFLVYFALSGLTHNSLGYERANLTTLFLFPVDPRHLLWGKNLLTCLLGLVEVTLAIGLFAVVTREWSYVFPAYVAGVIGLGIALGFGNVASVFFPSPVVLDPRNMRRTATNPNMSADQGCLYVLKGLANLVLELLALLPVLAGLILPMLFNVTWLWWLTIPASVAYSLIFYWLLTRWSAARLLATMPEIIERVTRVL